MTIRIALITNEVTSVTVSPALIQLQQQLLEQGIECPVMALRPGDGLALRTFFALTKKSLQLEPKQRFALPFDLLFYFPSDQSGDVRQLQGHVEVDAVLFWLNEEQLEHHCSSLPRGRGALNERALWLQSSVSRSLLQSQQQLEQWADQKSLHPWGLFGSSLSALSFLRQWLQQVLNASPRQFPWPHLIWWIPETLGQLKDDLQQLGCPERLALYHEIEFLRQQLSAEHPTLAFCEQSELYGLDQMSEDPQHLFATFEEQAQNRLQTQKLAHLFLLPGIDLAQELGATSSSLLPLGQEPGLLMASYLKADTFKHGHQQFLNQLLDQHFWPWLKVAEGYREI